MQHFFILMMNSYKAKVVFILSQLNANVENEKYISILDGVFMNKID